MGAESRPCSYAANGPSDERFHPLGRPRKRLLCVEDNEDILFMLTAILGRAGYDAESAGGHAQALEAARREHFDLFILDTKLGDESGLDLCRELRAAQPEARVIFYSAAVYDSDREAALAAGACAYVAKPGTAELVEAVRLALGDD